MAHIGSVEATVQPVAAPALQRDDPPIFPAWASLLPRCAGDTLAASFLVSLEVRGLSRNTVLAYGRAVESLIDMVGELNSVRLDRPTVHRFLAHLARTASRQRASRGRSLSRATIRQRVVGLRA